MVCLIEMRDRGVQGLALRPFLFALQQTRRILFVGSVVCFGLLSGFKYFAASNTSTQHYAAVLL